MTEKGPSVNDEERNSLAQTVSTAKARQDKTRRDIQGLRTVAITAVFVFHLWPKFFVNGYLGVDM